MSIIEINEPDIIADHNKEDSVLINLQNGLYFRAVGISSLALEAILNSKSICSLQGISANELKGFAKTLIELNLIRGDIEKLIFEGNEESSIKLELESYGDLEDLLTLDPIHDVSSTKGWPVKG